ncbi:MAG: glycosyltransferase family 4 protein [Planctomycetes bacterium]|nr:glycosyltransferase family 4 protein [Planctomycetota bacterium]MCH8261022.1 glycosyltransferase family 4 protein [Planctomycetota bacterium]
MPKHTPIKTLLILSQVYPPDPTSVGQHIADVAGAMAKRGYRVIVLTANRGYNDPSVKYESKELRDGVNVRRLPLSSFGKRSIVLRLLGQGSFLIQCIVRGLFVGRLSCLLVSTSPPMCSVAALLISIVRRRPITYWLMDLNPDQMIEMGWIKPSSPIVKIFNWFNRRILRRSTGIVALDRFMAERVLRKADVKDKLTVMPPWPHEGHLEVVAHADNPFRKAHGLDGKFVIMYSGNHSVCTPLRTVLDAALQLQDDPRLVFMFIGDGTGKREVDDTIAEHQPNNIRSLPYQPLSQIKYSLSAADVHLVVVGPSEVGVRHPCKIYGAMALGRPILLLGPDPCHASDLVDENDLGWHIQHGDVDAAISTIKKMVDQDAGVLAEMGQRGKEIVSEQLSQDILCTRFCDIIESGVQSNAAASSIPAH